MRLLIIVLSILLLFSVFGFVVTNLDARVAVTVWNTHYPAVPIHWVILWSLVAGVVYIGIIAVAEGINLRLANRRLTREVQRLETELNYLRTEPVRASSPPAAETAFDDPPVEAEGQYDPGDDRLELPSAPVYGSDEDEGDSDDEFYSGGRAV
ncbi:MAG: LapA family protein [Acidobacteriota bacterium]|nr:LapA family protein [Acidobacteriota bacterium]